MSSLAPANITGQNSFWVFAGLSILALVASVLVQSPFPLAVPFAAIFLAVTVLSPRYIFYLFFAILPFSVEIHAGSLGTDLPSEPLMLLLMGICIVLFIIKSNSTAKAYLLHPISLVLILHLSWIFLTSLTSTIPLFSFKFLLAKLWYVLPFFYLPLLIMREESDFRKVFRYLGGGLFIAIIYVLLNHAAEGFSFASSNNVMRPIFRNHVSYAVMLVAFLPYFWYMIRHNSKALSVTKYGLLLLLLVAIYFMLAIAFYWVVKFRLVKLSIGVTLIASTLLVMHLCTNNKYLDYAPDFSKTIAHKKFDNLVEATTKMQDISTVERFYRWIAGVYMIAEKPVLGFGPSTFYSKYNGYTVTSYMTYVSDNPEKSGMHNNYLMVAVEQGLPGLVIMLVLAILPLLYLFFLSASIIMFYDVKSRTASSHIP